MNEQLTETTPEFEDDLIQPLPEQRGEDRWQRVIAIGSAVIAGLAAFGRPAEACCCLGEPSCCTLATCTWCNYNVSPDRFYCPTGYNRFTWSCTDPGTGNLVWCGECTQSTSSCFQGSWICSAWFWN